MNKIIIKLVSPRAFFPSLSYGVADSPLGVTASCTADPASIGALHCASKAFMKYGEATADRDEIETRIALKEIHPGCGIWEATLQPPLAGATPATTRVSTWKSVADELPDADTTVMVYAPQANEEVWLGYYDGENWRDVSAALYDAGAVTHWMDIPEPPL